MHSLRNQDLSEWISSRDHLSSRCVLLEGSDPQVPGRGSVSQCGNAPWFPDPMSASPPQQWRTSQADIFLGAKIISFLILLGYHGQDDSYSAMGSGNVFANQIRWRKENVIFLMCDVNISLCASGWVHSQHERVEPT